MDIITSSTGIARALEVLHQGGVVAHATETCYGLACDLRNPKAVERLFLIKKRPLSQPVSALFSSLEDAKTFVVFSEKALELAKKYLPGPLTLVLPLRTDAPFHIYVTPPILTHLRTYALSTSVGIRLSSSSLAENLAKAFGGPIATTSANLHGQPNTYSVEDIAAQYGSETLQPDLVLDSGTIPVAPASTVVEVIGDAVKVLRQGDIFIV